MTHINTDLIDLVLNGEMADSFSGRGLFEGWGLLKISKIYGIQYGIPPGKSIQSPKWQYSLLQSHVPVPFFSTGWDSPLFDESDERWQKELLTFDHGSSWDAQFIVDSDGFFSDRSAFKNIFIKRPKRGFGLSIETRTSRRPFGGHSLFLPPPIARVKELVLEYKEEEKGSGAMIMGKREKQRLMEQMERWVIGKVDTIIFPFPRKGMRDVEVKVLKNAVRWGANVNLFGF